MYEQLIKNIIILGAKKASIISVSEIPFEPDLRKLCESNQCGNYSKSWTCPPYVGDVHELIKKAKKYKNALVFQTVSKIEDSFDFEGMQEGFNYHLSVSDKIFKLVLKEINPTILRLSAGWCKICTTCAKKENLPCRFPDKAIASLESYGINVSKLAKLADMNYINGVNTVTYFGAILGSA